jgi:ribosomal protein L37AE/L43A
MNIFNKIKKRFQKRDDKSPTITVCPHCHSKDIFQAKRMECIWQCRNCMRLFNHPETRIAKPPKWDWRNRKRVFDPELEWEIDYMMQTGEDIQKRIDKLLKEKS